MNIETAGAFGFDADELRRKYQVGRNRWLPSPEVT